MLQCLCWKPQLYDAGQLIPTEEVAGGATRANVTCLACLQVKRKQSVTNMHSLIWGECLHATPPPPVARQPMPGIEEVEQIEESPGVFEELDIANVEVEPLSSGEPEENEEKHSDPSSHESIIKQATIGTQSGQSERAFLRHPHACIAISDVATWGSHQSVSTDTDVPASCLLYTSPSPRDLSTSRMPSSA